MAFDEALTAFTPTAAASGDEVRVISASQTTMIMRRCMALAQSVYRSGPAPFD